MSAYRQGEAVWSACTVCVEYLYNVECLYSVCGVPVQSGVLVKSGVPVQCGVLFSVGSLYSVDSTYFFSPQLTVPTSSFKNIPHITTFVSVL